MLVAFQRKETLLTQYFYIAKKANPAGGAGFKKKWVGIEPTTRGFADLRSTN